MGNWGYGAPTRGVMGPYHFVGDVFLWWSNVRGYDHPIFHGNQKNPIHKCGKAMVVLWRMVISLHIPIFEWE